MADEAREDYKIAGKELAIANKATLDLDAAALEQTVRVFPHGLEGMRSFILNLSSASEILPPWWSPQRDVFLRNFFHKEPLFASACYSVVARNASLSWELKGPPRQRKKFQELLINADFGVSTGGGWQTMMKKVCLDLLTQDNGAAIEVIRPAKVSVDGKLWDARKGLDRQGNWAWYALHPKTGERQWLDGAYEILDSPFEMPLTIAHLDSARVTRTGDPTAPAYYYDTHGAQHIMRPWQILLLSEFPSAQEDMYNIGWCALSRVFLAAQILFDTLMYKGEKVGGRNPRDIWFANVPYKRIEDAIAMIEEQADNTGYKRFLQPIIIGTRVPNATPSVTKIELTSTPDWFDEDATMRWTLNVLAMGFAEDYGFFAPLPGQGLGTATQSETQARQARAKGLRNFVEMVQYAINYGGILPDSTSFRYKVFDAMEQLEHDDASDKRAKTRSTMIQDGTITPQVARRIALRDGDLEEEDLVGMGDDPEQPVGVAESDKPEEAAQQHAKAEEKRAEEEEATEAAQEAQQPKEDSNPEEKAKDKEEEKGEKGSEKSGWYGPPHGTHTSAADANAKSKAKDTSRQEGADSQRQAKKRKTKDGYTLYVAEKGQEIPADVRNGFAIVFVAPDGRIGAVPVENEWGYLSGMRGNKTYVLHADIAAEMGYSTGDFDKSVRLIHVKGKGFTLDAEAIGRVGQRFATYRHKRELPEILALADRETVRVASRLRGAGWPKDTLLRLEHDEFKPSVMEYELSDWKIYEGRKGGPGSGWHNPDHSMRVAKAKGQELAALAKKPGGHVWQRAGQRSQYRTVRKAVKTLMDRPVLPSDKAQPWHMRLRDTQGRDRGLLVGTDSIIRTVLGNWGQPREGSVEIVWGRKGYEAPLGEFLTAMKGGKGSGWFAHAGHVPGSQGGRASAGGAGEIPFDRAAASGKVTSSESLKGGLMGQQGQAEIVQYEGDGRGVVKDVESFVGHDGHNEVAAYEVSKLLGHDLVPQTVYVEGGTRTSQQFLEGAKMGCMYSESRQLQMIGQQRERAEAIVALDIIINNLDRHAGNYMFDQSGKLWAIDHGVCWWKKPTHSPEVVSRNYILARLQGWGDRPYNHDHFSYQLSPATMSTLRGIDRQAFMAAFDKVPGSSRAGSSAKRAWDNLQWIIERDGLIEMDFRD